jgi:rubrerythrin
MPDFGTPFAGLANDRKLTHEELVRAIRFMVAAEYEAVQLYIQLAESIDNELAMEVLRDIADEERVHAGEFLRLRLAEAHRKQLLDRVAAWARFGQLEHYKME